MREPRESPLHSVPGTPRTSVRIEASRLQALTGNTAAVSTSAVVPDTLAAQNRALADENRWLREQVRVLEKLASVDPLTGLANRRRFDHSLHQEVRRADRNDSALAVAMLDIDHFKRINDAHGHAAGDVVLRAVSGVLINAARRGGDLAARLGGEEFAILLPGADAETSMHLMESLRDQIGRLCVPLSSHVSTTVHVSIGVTSYDSSTPCAADAVLAAADSALYRAKRAGRNRVRYLRAPMQVGRRPL